MSKILLGRGKATVELSGDLFDAVDRTLRGAMPKTISAMEGATEAVLAAAAGRWPVKTGKSLRAFARVLRLPSTTEVEATIVNTAADNKGRPYAPLIKSGNALDGSTSPWQRLVRKPLFDQAETVATNAAEEIADVWRSRG